MKTVGVDIGGTNVRAILFDGKRILKKCSNRIEAKKGRKQVLRNIIKTIDAVITKDTRTIGMSTAGVIVDGRYLFSPNVPLANFNLKRFLEKKYKKKIVVENDANAFAWGEYLRGIGRKSRIMIGLIVGTGIGSGIIANNKIYEGTTGSAGEIGHTVIDRNGPTCSCGKKGHVEAFCSGPGIERRYQKKTGNYRFVKDIFDAKDTTSKMIVEETYELLAVGLANAVNILNPDMIILGGGVSNSLQPKRLLKKIKKYAIPGSTTKLKVVKSRLGNDAGCIGAALLPKK